MPAAGVSAFGTAVVGTEISTTAAAPAGTTGFKAVAAAVAAVFPAACPGTPISGIAAGLAAASSAITTAVTATAAAAIATTTAITTAAGATTTTASTGFSLVDAQRTAHQFGALQTLDGPGLAFGIRHLDEGKTALAAGVTLEGQRAADHVTERGEQLRDVFLFGTEGEVTDENAHRLTGTTDNERE